MKPAAPQPGVGSPLPENQLPEAPGDLRPINDVIGHVPVDRAPIVADPPVRPSPLDLPTRPGQELVDATASDALATLGNAGRLTGGKPDLDATKLQPQVSSAQVVDPSRPATLQELVAALTSGNFPPPLPVDPLALLEKLPDGIPRITYRVCSESKTKQVSCSLSLPLGIPAVVDATGDGTPDVLADLVPTVGVNDILGLVGDLLNVQRQLDDATARLNAILELLKDPVQVIQHPELLTEKLNLEGLLQNLNKTLQEKLQALIDRVQVGLGLLTLRLPTSETTGRDLPAHVWAVYDIPTHKRLSVGFDGFRRGSSLPTATLGVFSFNPAQAFNGIFDVNASLLQVGARDSLAVTAGLADVAQTDKGEALDPTVASARFSPVPTSFNAHALIDPGSSGRDQRATVDARSDKTTHLDAQILSNQHKGNTPTDRFDQLKVDMLPSEVSASLTRAAAGGAANVTYRANSVIDDVLFADYVYSGQTLNRAVQAGAKAVPAQWSGDLVSGKDKVTLSYRASGKLSALDANFYDRDPAIVLRGSLRDIPTAVTVDADLPGRHVLLDAGTGIGSATVSLSRKLGAYAPVNGEHATAVLNGDALGASARVTGTKKIDLFFGDHPHGTTEFTPGGQPFLVAGVIDGHLKSKLEVSNLPATMSFDLDKGNRTVAFRASSVINRVQAAFVDTTSGPSVFAAVNGLPASVDVNYDLGDHPRAHYKASSTVSRVELFVSPQGVETLKPDAGQYLSVAMNDVPTEADVLLDLSKRHLEGTMSAPVGGVDMVARAPFGGRDFTVLGTLTGVPARFDADFADGSMRFRGLSGPIGDARFAATNHAGALAPTGQHVSAHYRQSTGDIDASAEVHDLSLVSVSRDSNGLTFDMRSGSGAFAFDGDVVLAAGGADDTRYAALGTVSLPSHLDVQYTDGKFSYHTDRSVGVQAEAWIGKVAAINQAAGAPLYPHGVALTAVGCAGGAGCAKDTTPICALFDKCFGAVGTVNLPGLPTTVDVDMKNKQIDIDGYRPPPGVDFTAYLRLDKLFDDVPHTAAKAVLHDLPSPLDLHIGKFTVDSSGLDIDYTGSGAIGSLAVQVEADTPKDEAGTVRGEAKIAKVPARLKVTGTFGKDSHLRVESPSAIDTVTAQITGLYNKKPASAKATLSHIPACSQGKCVDVTIQGTDSHGTALKVPIVTVDSAKSGLDVEAYVQGSHRVDSKPVHLQLHDVFLRLKNAGSTIRTEITPDKEHGTYDTKFTSTPAADSLVVGGALSLQTDNIEIPDPKKDIPVCGQDWLATLHLVDSHIRVDTLDIGKIWVNADNVSSLTIVPGEFYLAYGVKGDYSKFGVGTDQLTMNIDGSIHIQVLKFDQDLIPPLFDHTITFDKANTHRTVTTHLFDQKVGPVADLKFKLGDSPVLYTMTLKHKPRVVDHVKPHDTVSGMQYQPSGDKAMVFSLIDPGLRDGDSALVDLAITYNFTPFEQGDEPGGC